MSFSHVFVVGLNVLEVGRKSKILSVGEFRIHGFRFGEYGGGKKVKPTSDLMVWIWESEHRYGREYKRFFRNLLYALANC